MPLSLNSTRIRRVSNGFDVQIEYNNTDTLQVDSGGIMPDYPRRRGTGNGVVAMEYYNPPSYVFTDKASLINWLTQTIVEDGRNVLPPEAQTSEDF